MKVLRLNCARKVVLLYHRSHVMMFATSNLQKEKSLLMSARQYSILFLTRLAAPSTSQRKLQLHSISMPCALRFLPQASKSPDLTFISKTSDSISDLKPLCPLHKSALSKIQDAGTRPHRPLSTSTLTSTSFAHRLQPHPHRQL